MQDPAPELRSRLSHARFLASVREQAPAGMVLQTHAQLDESLARILRRHAAGQDIHVFGYGSLMWNPALEHDGQVRARVHGWHRRFCLRNVVGRGAPDCPGLMLALDRGGSCNGMLLRIPGAKVQAEMTLLWRREMTWGSYEARWVAARVDGHVLPAVTFVANRQHDRYLKDLPLRDAARLINRGHGSLGSCRAYFDATWRKLQELGIEDGHMEQLRRVVQAGT